MGERDDGPKTSASDILGLQILPLRLTDRNDVFIHLESYKYANDVYWPVC